MTTIFPQCFECKHFDDSKNQKDRSFTCKAFPEGIPKVILHNEFEHTKPYEGDNGIRFEAKDSFNIK